MRTEDGYFIRKCLDGNSAAFGFLVDKYKAAVYAFAYYELRNFHDAEDVTQEAFVKAYQKLNTLRRWDNFLAWLYSITANLCKMHIRARSRRPDREFIADQDLEVFEEPSVDPRQENPVMEILNDALDSLPETYRRVLTLYYLGGMNSVEIARFLGTSPTAIRHRLNRGRLQLKEGMLAMMSQTLEGQRLQASFTFRIVEAVRHIKINPMPRATTLPWGMSVAAGVIFTILSLNPHLTVFDPVNISAGSPFSSEAGILKAGEITVDLMNITSMPTLVGAHENGIEANPNQKAMLMAPRVAGEGWSEKADMEAERAQFTVSAVNGKIYVFGGGADGILGSSEEYDPVTNTWKQTGDLPEPRYKAASSVVDGKIYIMGGYDDRGIPMPTVEEYDPINDTWQEKADMPTARTAFSASTVDGKIYAIGGFCNGGYISTVEEYDPKTDIWTTKTDMPTARSGLATAAVNGKIYAIGGVSISLSGAHVEEYDPETDTWTKKTPMPTRRMYLSACVVDGKIYAMGGNTGADALQTVEVYNPEADTWVRGTNMPTARTKFCAESVNGDIYSIGGMSGYKKSIPFLALSKVDEYDTGFVPPDSPKSIRPEGKLPTKWGMIKKSGRIYK